MFESASIVVTLPTFPEDFLRGVMVVKGIGRPALVKATGLSGPYISAMLNGRAKMPYEIFVEICLVLDLSPEEIRSEKVWYFHFDSEGNLPPRGHRIFDSKAREAYEKAQEGSDK